MPTATGRVMVPRMVTLCFQASPLHAAPDRPEEQPADLEESGFDARRYLELALNGALAAKGKRGSRGAGLLGFTGYGAS